MSLMLRMIGAGPTPSEASATDAGEKLNLKESVDVRYCLYVFVCVYLVMGAPMVMYSSQLGRDLRNFKLRCLSFNQH